MTGRQCNRQTCPEDGDKGHSSGAIQGPDSLRGKAGLRPSGRSTEARVGHLSLLGLKEAGGSSPQTTGDPHCPGSRLGLPPHAGLSEEKEGGLNVSSELKTFQRNQSFCRLALIILLKFLNIQTCPSKQQYWFNQN